MDISSAVGRLWAALLVFACVPALAHAQTTYNVATEADLRFALSSIVSGDFLVNAALIFDQAVNGTYSGSIGGSGTLVKEGGGTLTLTGANSRTRVWKREGAFRPHVLTQIRREITEGSTASGLRSPIRPGATSL